MAKLKRGIDARAVMMNGDTVFVAGPDRLMLYNPYAEQAFIADGRSGYIAEKVVQRVDTSYFKFNIPASRVALQDESLLVRYGKNKGLDLQALSQKVLAKEPAALEEFFSLRHRFDALTEAYWAQLWELLSLWTDMELHDFIASLETIERKAFVKYITNPDVTFPVVRPLDYYALYYPESYELMMEAD